MTKIHMKIDMVHIPSQVILFDDEKQKVMVLANGNKQLEFKGKRVIPLHSSGRMFNFKMEYNGEYFQSYVIGKDRHITGVGHVIEDVSEETVMQALENDDFDIKDDEVMSKFVVLFFD